MAKKKLYKYTISIAPFLNVEVIENFSNVTPHDVTPSLTEDQYNQIIEDFKAAIQTELKNNPARFISRIKYVGEVE